MLYAMVYLGNHSQTAKMSTLYTLNFCVLWHVKPTIRFIQNNLSLPTVEKIYKPLKYKIIHEEYFSYRLRWPNWLRANP